MLPGKIIQQEKQKLILDCLLKANRSMSSLEIQAWILAFNNFTFTQTVLKFHLQKLQLLGLIQKEEKDPPVYRVTQQGERALINSKEAEPLKEIKAKKAPIKIEPPVTILVVPQPIPFKTKAQQEKLPIILEDRTAFINAFRVHARDLYLMGIKATYLIDKRTITCPESGQQWILRPKMMGDN